MCEECGRTAYELQGIELEDGEEIDVCEFCYDNWEQRGQCIPHSDYTETDVYLR